MRSSATHPVFLAVALAGMVSNTWADGAAIVSHPVGGSPRLVTVTDGGIADINPARTPVPSPEGLTATTGAQADTSLGIMRGFAGVGLEADATVTQQNIGTPEEPAVSNPMIGNTLAAAFASSVLSLQATVGGAPGTTGSVTLQLDLHGKFLSELGVPTLELLGTLGAGRVNPNSPLDFQTFSSAFALYSNALDPGVIRADFESNESNALGEGFYAGADFGIVSIEPSDLEAVMVLTFDVTAGDQLALSAGVSGLAWPEFDPDDSELNGLYDVDGVVLFPDFEFDDGIIDVFQSAGSVDFSNTGFLRVLVSPGLTLEGEDPMLDNIVSASPVPLPAGFWLLVGGLPALWMRRRGGLKRDH